MNQKSLEAKFPPKRIFKQKTPLGALICSGCQKLGISIAELARMLDVSYEFARQIENVSGSLTDSDDLLRKIAELLNLNADELISLKPKRRLKEVKTTTVLGALLVQNRISLNLTQRDLAKLVGVNHYTIHELEIGDRVKVSSSLTQSFLEVFGLEINPEFISHSEPFVPKKVVRTKLGEYFLMCRQNLDLIVRKTSKLAGVSQDAIVRAETGMCHLRNITLRKICRALRYDFPTHLIRR